MDMVTVVKVKDAQRAWGKGIVAIATAHTNGGDYVGLATDHVNTLYAYQMGPVLFKPTLAAVDQFRPTFETALSYFVASNNACPEDQGFAIQGWTDVRFENSNVIIDGNTALAMGNYFFTSPEGAEVKVEYTFGYIEDGNGDLRIQLHHSSMPAESE
ncbi:MAG: phosphoribosyl-AMP cyclohydrolase, partial [Euryarchaeota archaeon]|nr:phosphoribosyl-AMP cyclohydrolase [Euryarchaeota archaeon]